MSDNLYSLKTGTETLEKHGDFLFQGDSIPNKIILLKRYFKISKNAIDMAQKLEKIFVSKGYKIFLDSPSNQKFFVLENSKYEISVETDSLLSIEGASNITFSGIEFSQSRKHAVLMKDINNVDFINCSFKNISAHGIYALSSN